MGMKMVDDLYAAQTELAASKKQNQALRELAEELDSYLREIRAENLDGSEPELGVLLDHSIDVLRK